VEVFGGAFPVDAIMAGAEAVTPIVTPTVENAAAVATSNHPVVWMQCYLCHENVLPNFTNARFAHFADASGSAYCDGTSNLHTIDPGILLGLRKHLPVGYRCSHEQSVGVSYLGCAACGNYIHVTVRNASGFEQRLLTQSAEMVKNGLVPVVITHKENCVAQLTGSDMDCTCDPEIVWGTLAERLAAQGAGQSSHSAGTPGQHN